MVNLVISLLRSKGVPLYLECRCKSLKWATGPPNHISLHPSSLLAHFASHTILLAPASRPLHLLVPLLR